MNDYKTITLVSRDGINCSNISMEEFVRMMFSDILEADEKYNDLYCPDYVAGIIRGFESYVDSYRKAAIRYAEKKWKTEKKRNEYVEKETEAARKRYNRDAFYYDLSFFDFNVTPGEMGLSGNCCISYRDLTPAKLRRCYEAVKDNKYFKKAMGWKLTYEASNNSYRASFRPQIKLIVDEETENQMVNDEKRLTESVNKFYENCNYWGD